MSLAKKYGIEEYKIKAMIKDGVISSSWPHYEEIYYHYKQLRRNCSSDNQAIEQTAAEKRYSLSQVYTIIKKFE